ncbi:MAG: ribonuclease HII [Pseudomonadota bacterium]
MSREQEKDIRLSRNFEREAAGLGALRIAGIDEAGRGPLAGPVTAAAVILPWSADIAEINDSKLLTEKRREALYAVIRDTAVAVGTGVVGPETIDQINILQAVRLAMSQAVAEIEPAADFLLIDGPLSLDINLPQKGIVKGDRLSASIAAASIIAKVTRDRIMRDLDALYPGYGFAVHKGYPTPAHKDAVSRYGPSPVHRRTFRGVKEHLRKFGLL